MSGYARVVDTFAEPGWDHPQCVFCDGDLARSVVEWEDGSVSIAWICSCEPTDADIRALADGESAQPPNPSELLQMRGLA
uniref:Uncharacterized protein n=1 Tax=viral metagenome TaxID=1070528 RepID=A0A6M3LQW8_9ZZZZ